MPIPQSRTHAVLMGAFNAATAVLLLLICLVNADHGYPNPLVTLVGPITASSFALWSFSWFASVRRNAASKTALEHLESPLVHH